MPNHSTTKSATHTPPKRIDFATMPVFPESEGVVGGHGNTKLFPAINNKPVTDALTLGTRRHLGKDTPFNPDPKQWVMGAQFSLGAKDTEPYKHDHQSIRNLMALMVGWALHPDQEDWFMTNEDSKQCVTRLKAFIDNKGDRLVDVLSQDYVFADQVALLYYHFLRSADQAFWMEFKGVLPPTHMMWKVASSVLKVQKFFREAGDKAHHFGFEISTHFMGLYLWIDKDTEEDPQ